jgi:hypothetical protein
MVILTPEIVAIARHSTQDVHSSLNAYGFYRDVALAKRAVAELEAWAGGIQPVLGEARHDGIGCAFLIWI